MNTEKAKAMLKALKGRCSHGSSYTCAVCEARITAEVWFEGLGFTPATLAVAIKLAEAAEKHAESKQGYGCDRCRDALAEWERL